MTELALNGPGGVSGVLRRRSQSSNLAIAGAASGMLAMLVLLLGWRGSDLPAQVYRVELYRRYGLVLWDSQWFAGHATFGYSVLSPVLGALTGARLLGALSGVASALLFERIVQRALSPASRLGSLWFAVGTVTNLVVGRITFAFGVAIALAAIFALQHRKTALAAVCALAAPLASPLAGLFLAIGVAAWGLARRDRRTAAALVAAAAVAPTLIAAALFPGGGSYPFPASALMWDLSVCALFFLLTPRHQVELRWGAIVYGVVVVGAFVVASPLGENVNRFGRYAAGPLLLCVLAPRRRVLLAMLAVPLLVWQWVPTLDTITAATHDPSIHRSYYQPLLTFLDSMPPTVGRVEVPSTYRHWESAYLSPQVPLARGWERQLDIGYNPIFYGGTLDAATYETWLGVNGVEYVALPDARLDSSSTREKSLILHGLAYLEPVWHNAHWRVWKFSGYHGLVEGSADVVSVQPDGFTLDVRAAGELTVRIHMSPRWYVDHNGCIAKSGDGWTHVLATKPGIVRVTQSLQGTPCS